MASSIQNFDLEYLASAIADQVKTRLAFKQDTLQLDAVPTQNSTKFVNSGGIKTALDSLPKIYLFTTAEWNALTNEQKATYLGNIVYITDDGSGIGGQIDSVPTDGSTNLVTSNGVYDAINDVSEAVDEKSDLSNIVDETKSETEVTAEKQHNAGEYFDIYGTLVKATDDIAIGDTLTEGVNGNYETTDITSELLSMKSSFTAGCNTIVSAVTAKGQTPVSNSPSDIATAIENISSGGTEGLEDLITYLRNQGHNVTRNSTVEELVTALEQDPGAIEKIDRYYFYKNATTSTNLNSTYINYTEYTNYILVEGLKSSGLAAGDRTIYIPDYDTNNKQIMIG